MILQKSSLLSCKKNYWLPEFDKDFSYYDCVNRHYDFAYNFIDKNVAEKKIGNSGYWSSLIFKYIWVFKDDNSKQAY